MNSDYIKDNIAQVMKRIDDAAKKSGRTISDVTAIAVTKTVEPERILKAVEAGLYNLGENRVQELCEKYDWGRFSSFTSLNWHLIGHLQTNKVKYIIDKVKMIHSLDRIELAEEIQKRAKIAGRIIDVLVQVNIAEEESKFGMKKEMVYDFLKKASKYSNIKVKGLMTIAPLAENPEDVRWVFRELGKLHIDIMRENIDNIDMDYLSMGMSNDFEVAIEEGSNMVRIGTAIFGKR
jgi:pyridoxal phosphate enzyme, YggS family